MQAQIFCQNDSKDIVPFGATRQQHAYDSLHPFAALLTIENGSAAGWSTCSTDGRDSMDVRKQIGGCHARAASQLAQIVRHFSATCNSHDMSVRCGDSNVNPSPSYS